MIAPGGRRLMSDKHTAVTVNDVGPRDGLQNQRRILNPGERYRLECSGDAAGRLGAGHAAHA